MSVFLHRIFYRADLAPWALVFPIFLFFLFSCDVETDKTVYESDELSIIQLSDKTYIHISYLQSERFGKVACNGLIFISGNEAIVFDTPVDDSASTELVNWLQTEKRAEIKSVVVNHFHNDCLGGLNVFHEHGIASWSNLETISLIEEEEEAATPENGFKDRLTLYAGEDSVINRFLGEGHTSDNIVSYIPVERTLFGGCMIKSLGGKEGYLGDANLEEWSNTADRVLNEFPYTEQVIPGHGAHGDKSLVEYTSTLFDKYRRVSEPD